MCSRRFRPVLVIALVLLCGCPDSERAPGSTGPSSTVPSGPADSNADLVEAAAAGNEPGVRRALDGGADPNGRRPGGPTALMLATFDGHTEVARTLLEHGAVVDERDASGRTALMYASSGPFADTVSVLLEHGANPNLADASEGWTALMFAAGEGHWEVVRALLDYGADTTISDADGDTAAVHARTRGHTAIVELLGVASE